MLDFPDAPTVGLTYSSGGLTWTYDGTKWVAATPAVVTVPKFYIIACYAPGTLTASQSLLLHRFAATITIPADFGSYNGRTSQARGSAAATASTVIAVRQATSAAPTSFADIGTINFAPGAVVGTLSSSASALTFAAGDTLALVAPATADATFAGLAATLVGYET